MVTLGEHLFLAKAENWSYVKANLEAGKNYFIIDDNIIGSGQKYINRAFRFFERLKDANKEWGGQTYLNIVEYDGLLKAASASGAKSFLIGFESIHKETLMAYGEK